VASQHSEHQLAYGGFTLGTLVAASVVSDLATPLGITLLARLAQDPEAIGSQPISPGLATSARFRVQCGRTGPVGIDDL
jgi:hypothetical protein